MGPNPCLGGAPRVRSGMAGFKEWWEESSEEEEAEWDEYTRHQALRGAAHRQRRAIADLLPHILVDGRGPQGKKVRRESTPFNWDAHLLLLTEDEFKQRYRLDFESFNHLLDLLRPHLELSGKKKTMSVVGNFGIVVAPEVKLAIALRYLAGGDPLDLKLIYHVSKKYVYDCVYLVIDAINATLSINFPLTDVGKLKELEADFRAASRGGCWEGQVGAIDGVHFAMRAPSKKDVPDPMKYFVARKDEYAILCIAVCDAHRRFTSYDISKSATTHDSLAWEASDLGARVAHGELPEPFFINADSAFTLSNSIITPSGDPALDAFDYHQSSNRMPIECAFGMLVRKWGVFWRPLGVRFDRRAPLVGACMRLHNYCIDRRIECEKLSSFGAMTEVVPGRLLKTPLFDREGRPVHHLDIDRGPRPDYRRMPRSTRRDALVECVASSGVVRPLLALAAIAPRRNGRAGGRGRGRGRGARGRGGRA
jgi:hypothetical protein